MNVASVARKLAGSIETPPHENYAQEIHRHEKSIDRAPSQTGLPCRATSASAMSWVDFCAPGLFHHIQRGSRHRQISAGHPSGHCLTEPVILVGGKLSISLRFWSNPSFAETS